ncbi:hypothetical protein [Runella slithyformis]|uniref:Uncharacterized protein n=1 Tax=Runella slithyformis (strain ATCC 29530 / DSM 19594 / LMG 11500 / NCIMB 11436 / LSU 4) TaxID=761193 RepID=A0A7U3ZI36_RUNSL|nr:hypothetical protein [Runella slithyformis]AEI47642.1 hypothetical protein Runsl_1214 [Runella slithyformis DSM 19594]
MTAEAHKQAEAIRATAMQIQQDASNFQHCINLAALKSKAPAKYGAHELAKRLKDEVAKWEKELIDKANEAYARI